MPNKADTIWLVNILSFLFFTVLAITGLTNWLLLPRGYGAGGGFLVSLRHLLRAVHQWTALLLIIIVLVHLALHWAYLKSKLKNNSPYAKRY